MTGNKFPLDHLLGEQFQDLVLDRVKKHLDIHNLLSFRFFKSWEKGHGKLCSSAKQHKMTI